MSIGAVSYTHLTINHALYVVTEKICKKRQMSLAEEYWSHGKRKVEADCWRSVLRGDLGNEEKEIQMEIERYGLGLEKEKRYTLVSVSYTHLDVYKRQ